MENGLLVTTCDIFSYIYLFLVDPAIKMELQSSSKGKVNLVNIHTNPLSVVGRVCCLTCTETYT